MASSPDGIISCDCRKGRLLEVKCPYNYRTGLIDWEQETKFPITDENKIKIDHPHYHQIQGQLDICGHDTCKLMIWTPKTTMTVTIMKDNDFIEKMFSKLDDLFFNDILPELIFRKKCTI